VGYFDFLLLGARNQRPAEAYVEAFLRLREQGKVRHLAISTHNRPLVPSLLEEFRTRGGPFEVLMFRYNAVHRGAERDIFPFVPRGRRPGLIAYTATRWGHLLDPAKMPPGETPPSASDCYRFALSRPDVDLVLSGPANAEQMEEALRALDLGPLDEDELERMRRIGDHVYRHNKPQFRDLGDAADEGRAA
jgi:aryl-alcohol dehydrogenase-like predicted oxidoreductase